MSSPVKRFRVRLLRAAAVLPLGAAGLAVQAGVAAPAALAAASMSFTYTGGEQTYPVPAGVTAVTVTAVGAPGGTGLGGGGGGDGAVVTATVPLPAGATTLFVEVGGAGAPGSGNGTGNAFNGGGSSAGAGGGGGASDVRTTSIATIPDSALTTASDSRLVVAGGGGGGGGSQLCQQPTGGPGGTAGDTSVTGAGNGGAAAAGGCAAGDDGGFGAPEGTGGPGDLCNGVSGLLGQGGNADTGCDPENLGGGGGGGYYGGGGGGDSIPGGGGGGAGSSYWVPGARGTSMSEDTTGSPEVIITPLAWPAAVVGTPHPTAHSTLGYYLGLTWNTWTLEVTQPGPGKVRFTGTITINAGHLTKVTAISLEHGDSVTLTGRTLSFAFTNSGDIDGIRFPIPSTATTSVTFTLDIGGQPATASQISLGNPGSQPSTGSPLTFTR